MHIAGVQLFETAAELNQLIAGTVFAVFVVWALLSVVWLRRLMVIIILTIAVWVVWQTGAAGLTAFALSLWTSTARYPSFVYGMVLGVAVVLVLYSLLVIGCESAGHHNSRGGPR